MLRDVRITAKVEKSLQKIPRNIQLKFFLWASYVKDYGLLEVRRLKKSYHDEPLQGKRQGQRSIRLNKSYRAIYEIKADGAIEFIEVQEVNKHDY